MKRINKIRSKSMVRVLRVKRDVFYLCVIISLLTACGKETKEIGLNQMGIENSTENKEEELNIVMDTQVEEDIQNIVVYICGAVVNPGVYEFDSGERITDGIEKAGGFSAQAYQEYWNLAQLLLDGEKIYVPTKDEVEKGQIQEATEGSSNSKATGKININTASKEELMSLTGVGEAKALSIISYRETNGSFSSIEDIMKISGIKDAVFNTIKEQITV